MSRNLATVSGASAGAGGRADEAGEMPWQNRLEFNPYRCQNGKVMGKVTTRKVCKICGSVKSFVKTTVLLSGVRAIGTS
jgi:hypothetical protein